MSKVVGGPLTSGVITQLNLRQGKYGKLTGRTDKDLQYLTSKTGWVKLTSGVDIQGKQDTAAEYILIGGQIGRFGDQAYSTFDGKTGKGFRPMPGITGVQVRCLNKFGVLKEATVTFNCWDVDQIRNLELLYMRPGFTALVEWGHSVYYTGEDTLDTVPSTVGRMLAQAGKGAGSKEVICSEIERLRLESKYNYDGILGLITNFSWTFRPDGGYDCVTTISSIGNIIESSIIDTDVSANTSDNSPSPTTSTPAPEEVQPSTMIETVLKEIKKSGTTALTNIQTYYPEYWTKYKSVNDVETMEIITHRTFTREKSGISTVVLPENIAWVSLKTLCQIINAAQLIDQNNNNIIKLNNKFTRSSTFRSFKDHVASDPKICLIVTRSVDSWYTDFPEAKTRVETGRSLIGGISLADEILNIFVNVDIVINTIATLRDQPKESRTLSNLLLPVLQKITEALGNVNEFDLHYEESEVIYYIVDRMVKPVKSTIPTVQVTGLKSTVTQFSFTSKISPTTSTMLAISAQASAADVGLEAEALLAWNKGLRDRIILQKKQKINDNDQEGLTAQRISAQTEREAVIIKALGAYWRDELYFVDLIDAARTNFTQYATSYLQYREPGTPAGIIPFEVEIHMEGISGIKQGQVFRVNAGIMPVNYDDTVAFLVTGINHDIKDNKWITILKAQTIVIGEKKKEGISAAPVKRGITVERLPEPKPEPEPTPETPPPPPTPPQTPAGVNKSKNYIIGDSQTPYIDMNSSKASRISDTPGEASLWQGSKNLSWLKNAVAAYPVSTDVNSIIINIGTNGVFSTRDDISGLMSVVKQKFPNAKIFAVKGSWGWKGNKYNAGVTEEQVKTYYNKFKTLGAVIIEPAIGKVDDPHGNIPIYKQIGADIDRNLQ